MAQFGLGPSKVVPREKIITYLGQKDSDGYPHTSVLMPGRTGKARSTLALIRDGLSIIIARRLADVFGAFSSRALPPVRGLTPRRLTSHVEIRANGNRSDSRSIRRIPHVTVRTTAIRYCAQRRKKFYGVRGLEEV